MKWLIISDDTKKTEKATSFLSTLGENLKDVSAFHFKAQSQKLLPMLEQCDICLVFFDSDSKAAVYSGSTLSCGDAIVFAVGFCAGKKNKIFGAGATRFLCSTGIAPSDCFENENTLFDFIKKSYQDLVVSQNAKESFLYLFQNGMPFTADSFAFYIEKNELDICQKYIAAGMNANARTNTGTPMLNVATRAENTECVKWLLECGADINARSVDRGYTAIMDAVWTGNLELVKFFIEKGAQLNTVSKEGQSMLVLAVGANRKDICQILSDHGENPDIPDAMGMSAYAYAKLFKHDDIASILEKNHKEA